MKIIAENPAEEALLWRIKALSDELVNQDNRFTRMPVWTILDNNKAGEDYGAVMYFTGKAAEQHINENNHHYKKPMICVRSAHDNRELKDVIHLLILAGGNEIPSNHYGTLRDA
nr:MAG TPA: hypothetical protein [Caudoviricetes sp.]